MIRRLQDSRHARHIAFIGVSLAPIIVVFGMIVLPVRDHFADQNARIMRQSEMLTRLKAIAAYEAKLTTSDHAENGMEEYLAGPNEGVASASLQTRLKIIVQTAGAQVRSIQGLPTQASGSSRLIGARVDLAGQLKAVHGAIFAIEDAKPYFFITDATIKVSRNGQRPDNRVTAPIIEARLDVFGAFKPKAEP